MYNCIYDFAYYHLKIFRHGQSCRKLNGFAIKVTKLFQTRAKSLLEIDIITWPILWGSEMIMCIVRFWQITTSNWNQFNVDSNWMRDGANYKNGYKNHFAAAATASW
eukprot:11951136-Ditylum_brightwellii.AAC.1